MSLDHQLEKLEKIMSEQSDSTLRQMERDWAEQLESEKNAVRRNEFIGRVEEMSFNSGHQEVTQLQYPDPDDIYSPSHFKEAVLHLNEHGVNENAFLSFWDPYGDKFALRPRELTIVFGSRGSYKSTVINYLVATMIMQRQKVGYLSYEMDTPYLLTLLAQQMGNSPDVTPRFVSSCIDFAQPYLHLINEMVDTPSRALGKIEFMLQAGCNLVILDCLQRIHMPQNDMNLEREFVVHLTSMAREQDAHIIIVHHSRKGSTSQGDNPKPVIDDLKGSGGLADNAQNVVAVWSDKQKKDELFWIDLRERNQTPLPYDADRKSELQSEPDVLLMVKKQRLVGFEGNIGLFRTNARAFHAKGRKIQIYTPGD